MEHLQEDDLIRLNKLLHRTGEFIAYFEVVETKMMEWRHELDEQTTHINTLAQTIGKDFNSIHELLTQTGINTLRQTIEHASAQAGVNLRHIEKQCVQFNDNFQQQQDQLKQLTQQCIEKIDRHTTEATQSIASQLSKYDVHHFHRIASESCDHVERVANHAVNQSSKLLKLFQLRFGIFTAITSIITAFIVVLYLSDESPWEMHRQALNERRAGKLLLKAWPSLSQLEKTKILNHDSNQRS